MGNIYETTVNDCFGVKIARSHALRKCVIETSSLRDEFHNTVDLMASTEEFTSKLTDFIRSKGLRILDEKPIVRIVDDRYRVDVRFKVTW